MEDVPLTKAGTPRKRAPGAGRKRVGPETVVRMPEEWRDALDYLAEVRVTTRAALVRQAVAETYADVLPNVADPFSPRYASRRAGAS